MKLTVFNGSPRGRKSNTTELLKYFAEGFLRREGNEMEIQHLVKINDTAANVEKFNKAEFVIIAFPLYTDAMPGIVKHFIENLAPLNGGRNNRKLGFIVQSGFPEAVHSRFVERYLEKLTRRLGREYSGTAVKGGIEGIRMMPPFLKRKLRRNFIELGKLYGESGEFSPGTLKKLAPRERMTKRELLVFRLFQKIGFSNFYWNGQLRRHKAFNNRFAKPFED